MQCSYSAADPAYMQVANMAERLADRFQLLGVDLVKACSLLSF